MLFIFFIGIVAFIVAFGLTPLVRDLFLRMGVVDMPDQERKLHGKNIPRVGGIAVFVAYAATYVASAAGFGMTQHLASLAYGPRWWLFAGVAAVFFTGLLDDLLTLRPKQKLLGQIIAAVLVWSGGIEVNVFHGVPFGQWLTLPLTVAWLVGCTNAFNLIDGLDGLAAGTGLFATVTMILAALLTHNYGLALVTVPLAGCLLAFLCFNFNPASIFLGDCGSLTIGFLLGCFGMIWSQKITTVIGLAAPLMAVSIPLLDTSIAIVRRLLRNRPIFSPDRGHIHHRLLDRGYSVRKTALILYAAGSIAAGLALMLQFAGRQFEGLAIALFAVLVCFGVQQLGYMEFRVAGRILSTRLLFRMVDDEMRMEQLDTQLGGAIDDNEAIDLVRKTCVDLGVKEVFVAGHADEVIDLLLDLSVSQVHLPIDSSRTLVLHGLPVQGRPLPIERLSALVRKHMGQPKLSEHPVPSVFDYSLRELSQSAAQQ